ncbi:hypothetical protein HanXRQr2_Chr10g0421411 [Helianthus annuus]|uniref:Uncharacterized protein n=1 Tax=Helianthus annuus TaxID=4232 RepID=A0A9K3N3B2_HELAN|nr:hypothetical protein HanXRQr2_Chr10g0421411 [Helianthus annuus]
MELITFKINQWPSIMVKEGDKLLLCWSSFEELSRCIGTAHKCTTCDKHIYLVDKLIAVIMSSAKLA